MPKASPIQNTFNGGEVSPLIYGRQDVDKYNNSLSVCFNGVPIAQGAWTRRPGTQFQATTKLGGTNTCRIFPFRYSTTQNYILEIGHLYLRWHTNGGVLLDSTTADSIEGITNADPGVVTMTGHAFSNGDRVLLTGLTDGVDELNNVECIVANAGVNTIELTDIYGVDINTTNMSAWVSGGTVTEILEVATPWSATEVATLRITQDEDTVYFFHPDHEVNKLVRNSATSWTLSEVLLDDGPYLPLNGTAITLALSGTTGSVTVTASSALFASTDVDRNIRWKDPAGNWTWLTITAFASSTSVTADINGPNASATTATTDWRLGLYSDTTGHPAVGTFFEDRLVLGGSTAEPQRVDYSRTGDYTNFSPSDQDETVTDSHAIAFTLNSDDVNTIRWMIPDEKALLAGTTSGEWPLRPSTRSEATTPSNISGKQSTKYGSAQVQPVRADKAVLFVQKAGRKLRELAYVFEADGFKAPDMTIIAEHITVPTITELAYVAEPQTIAWAVRSDGVLLSFTYERDQNVTAWARHELGGYSDAGNTLFAEVESIASIPNSAGTADELYVIVKRYINGATQRYLEVLTKIWETGDLQEDAFHLDCGDTIVQTSSVNVITGLYHLEGESITPYIDGKNHPAVTVADGSVTLQVAAEQVTFGYAYNSDGEMLAIEAGAADGSAQGKTKRIARLGVWLMDTLGLKIGSDENNLDEILVRTWGADYGTPTAIFTGVTRESFDGDYDRLGQVYWRCEGPFPATVLAVAPQLVTMDDG